MRAMDVAVSFRVWLGDGELLDENELETTLAERTEELRAREELEGAVVIRSSGNPDVVVEDALAALALNLCFGAVTELAADRSATYRYYASYGYFRLDPEGWQVRLSGDDVPTVHVHRPELQEGLLACGERIMRLLEHIGGQEAEGSLGVLRPRAEAARTALASAPTSWPGIDPATLES
jgi:hypothetical protein